MDLAQLMPWLVAANTIISLGTAAYALLTSGSKANSERIIQVEAKLADGDRQFQDKLTDHDRRIQSIESELKHLPDKDTVVELRLSMAELSKKVAVMGESVGSVSRTVLRIDDYLHKRERVE